MACALTPLDTDVVIVGAGHAGVECAFALRSAGHQGGIALLSEEPHIPYQRPPLSKAFLSGDTSLERIALKSVDGFEKHGITLLRGEQATRLDAAGTRLTTDAGRTIAFKHCVLATGARARALPELEGRPGVHAIRTLDDALALQRVLVAGVRLLVIGGGYLGLETASTAAKLGVRVTVLEQAPALMGGRVSDYTAGRFETLHQEAGVSLVRGGAVRAYEHDGSEWTVSTHTDARYQADLILVSIGAVPNTALAEQAGLACEAGIVVDAACRTSNPAILAIGDCASSHRDALGCHARVESVQNAMEQARIAAACIAGNPSPAPRPNTFWSEQQGKRLQMAGLARPGQPCDEVVHSTRNGWVVERYQNGMLAVIEAVDSPVEFMKGTKRVGHPADAPASVTNAALSQKEATDAHG